MEDCINLLLDSEVIKTEASSLERIFLTGCESFSMEDIRQSDEICKTLPSDCECDIVNLNISSNDVRIVDIPSPESWNSSHYSVMEGLSGDSRASTNQTLSTNPSVNEICVICNDLATGKHYGVSACEGCKGFFKRTIRKKLSFTCREVNKCLVTEKLRNRCQACRFKKCLEKGMKIDAVQKERPAKRKLSLSDSSASSPESIITADSIYKNEMSSSTLIIDFDSDQYLEVEEEKLLCSIINKQLFSLVMWAKSVPGFDQLDRSDQMILLNKSWVDIFLASVAFRSAVDSDSFSLKMDNTYRLTLSVSSNFGLQSLIIRIIHELVNTLKCMSVDQMEMACLKLIILFDSKYTNLKDVQTVRDFRFCIFDILKKYVAEKYPLESSRIYKLLLRLSSIRGLTTCFVQRMKDILQDCCLNKEMLSSSTADQSSSDFLFPLFNEMMKQPDFPFS